MRTSPSLLSVGAQRTTAIGNFQTIAQPQALTRSHFYFRHPILLILCYSNIKVVLSPRCNCDRWSDAKFARARRAAARHCCARRSPRPALCSTDLRVAMVTQRHHRSGSGGGGGGIAALLSLLPLLLLLLLCSGVPPTHAQIVCANYDTVQVRHNISSHRVAQEQAQQAQHAHLRSAPSSRPLTAAND